MKKLPLTKMWSGDGFGANPVTLNQIKRNEIVAIYQQSHNEIVGGFEVFRIKIRCKGESLPGGDVEMEDREVYPSANSFGKSAYFCFTLAAAEKRFGEMMGQTIAPEPLIVGAVAIAKSLAPNPSESTTKHRGRPRIERPRLMIPTGEFSMKDMAELNKVEYITVQSFLKENAELVKFAREERRSARGPMTKLFTKTS
jgi:hypothetical protein